MKKTLLTIAVAAALSSASALACTGGDPTCLSTGTVDTSVIINGGGSAIVNQTGPGTSSADFTTTSGGYVDGSTSVTPIENATSGSVTTNAVIDGQAWSTTTGTVVGTAAGSNYSNSNVSGSANVDGSVTFGDSLGGGTLNAGSGVTGSAGAGSAVEINNLDGALGTDPITGYSYQEAGFHADNTSIAEGSIGEMNEYCDTPSDLNLYLNTAGNTSTYANGTLDGVGASGGSGAFAGEGGYANGEVHFTNEYLDAQLAGSVGGLINEGTLNSYSRADNLDGETYSAAGSASDALVTENVNITVDECCVPTTEIEVGDRKFVEGTVTDGDGVAGGGVTVDFNTTVNTSVTAEPTDPTDPSGENNGWGNGDQTPPGFSGPNNNAENYEGGALDYYEKGVEYWNKAQDALAAGDLNKYEEYMLKAQEKFDRAEEKYQESLNP